MKFEEGKSYRLVSGAKEPAGFLRDGYPHLCLRSIPDGADVHASFDCDESATLLTCYTPEEMKDFTEAAQSQESYLLPSCLVEASPESTRLFGADAEYLGNKTWEVLRGGVGGNIETAILKAIRSGALTGQDLAAFTAYTMSKAYNGSMSGPGELRKLLKSSGRRKC